MQKQKTLPLCGDESLDGLWERFPECSREELIIVYARLIAAAARRQSTSGEKEVSHDELPR